MWPVVSLVMTELTFMVWCLMLGWKSLIVNWGDFELQWNYKPWCYLSYQKSYGGFIEFDVTKKQKFNRLVLDLSHEVDNLLIHRNKYFFLYCLKIYQITKFNVVIIIPAAVQNVQHSSVASFEPFSSYQYKPRNENNMRNCKRDDGNQQPNIDWRKRFHLEDQGWYKV